MCYYTTYLFLACGHVTFSNTPVLDSHCSQRDAQTIPQGSGDDGRAETVGDQHIGSPAVSLPSPPATPTPPSCCQQKLAHPLHTFRMTSLCNSCQEERDARIDAFEDQMKEDVEQRILDRSAVRNERRSGFGRRRLFRSSTTYEMIMDAPASSKRVHDESWDGQSQTETLRSPTGDDVAKIMDGFRRRVGWNKNETASITGESGRSSSEQSAAPPSSPTAGRLSFAAFGGAPDQS